MTALMSDIARTPSVLELANRIRSRSVYEGPSTAAIVRRDRERPPSALEAVDAPDDASDEAGSR